MRHASGKYIAYIFLSLLTAVFSGCGGGGGSTGGGPVSAASQGAVVARMVLKSAQDLPSNVGWTRVVISEPGNAAFATIERCFAAADREGDVPAVPVRSGLTVYGEWLDNSQPNCGGKVLATGSSTVSVVGGQTSVVDLLMSLVFELTGSVTTGTGGAISGTQVLFDDTRYNTSADSSNGTFTAKVPAGTYTLTASAGCNYRFTPESRQVTVINAAIGGLTFIGSEVMYMVSGVVVAGTNTLDGAKVELFNEANTKVAEMTTVAGGAFQFPNVSNGIYSLAVTHNVYSFDPVRVTVNCGNQTPSVTAKTPPTNTYKVRGCILPVTLPLQGIAVTASGTTTSSTSTGSDGCYDLFLPNGSYQITPSSCAYSFVPASVYAGVNGADRTVGDITAQVISRSISGTVSSASGIVEGAKVTLTGKTNPAMPQQVTYTSQSGSYTFTGLSKGGYTLQIEASGITFTPSTVDVTIDCQDISQNFGAGCDPNAAIRTISGVVSTPGGSPDGVKVYLRDATDQRLLSQTTTSSTGAYSFGALKSGSYQLIYEKSGYSFSPSPLTLPVGCSNVTASSVTATALPVQQIVVTPVVRGSGGTVSPNTPQFVISGSTFVLQVNTDSGITALVSGCGASAMTAQAGMSSLFSFIPTVSCDIDITFAPGGASFTW